jgi:hypothetical protein
MRALPENGGVGRLLFNYGIVRYRFKALEAERKKPAPMPVGKESKVPDSNETLWQMVQQKATKKLMRWYRHGLLNISMGSVSPAECDVSILKRN